MIRLDIIAYGIGAIVFVIMFLNATIKIGSKADDQIEKILKREGHK